MKTLRVLMANRCPGRFWSIEELFASIAQAFPESVRSTVATAPRSRASPGSLAANLLWAASLRDCDVIHQTGDIHYAVLGMWRCPAVLTIHDLRFIEEARGLKRLLFQWLWLELPCRRAAAVTVISEFTRQRLLAFCRMDPDKVRVIPNCVAPEFVPRHKPWPASTPRLLVAGTTPNKNLERVAAACAGMDVMFCILGCLSGDQRQLLDQAGLKFEEHSGLSRGEVVGLYQSCDLVCFVSTYEGFGMPILEGQAVGRPVLTSNLAPMNSVAGSGALLVDPSDVAAIRGGLLRLLDDAALRKQLVRKGFENVKAYSAQSVAAQYAALYGEVVGRR
jgi:glycosyltransferase involved in cell wall biosynthesis